MMSKEGLQGLKTQYQEKGYVVLKGLFSQDEVTELKAQVEPIFDSWFRANKSTIFDHQLLNMHSLTRPDYFSHDPEKRVDFFNAMSHPNLTNVVDCLFGEGLYFHNTQLFFNPTHPDKKPYWHRDMQYSPYSEAELAKQMGQMLNLHVRIPLLPETGIALIPGTHQRWDSQQERQVRLELDGYQNHHALDGETLISLELGDVLIFDAQMLHRGHYAHNAERKALDLCVSKYHPFTAPFLDKSCLPTPEEMAQIKNNAWFQHGLAIAKDA